MHTRRFDRIAGAAELGFAQALRAGNAATRGQRQTDRFTARGLLLDGGGARPGAHGETGAGPR
jgi:hypothetical protein